MLVDDLTGFHLLRSASGGYLAIAAASAVQSHRGLSPLTRTAASSALADSRSARNVAPACSRATVHAPIKSSPITPLSQCTLHATRLYPKARPRARIASVSSGAISLRMSAQAQPIAVCPEGYEPFFIKNFPPFGVQVGSFVHSTFSS
jgi:hypothetical protein